MVLLWWESVGGAFIIRGPFARLIIAWQITYSSEKYSVVCGKIFQEKIHPQPRPVHLKMECDTVASSNSSRHAKSTRVWFTTATNHARFHALPICMFGRNAHHITHMLVRKLVHPLMENVLNNLISGKKKNPTTQFPSASRLTLSDHTCSDISVRQFTFDMFIIAAKHVRVSGPCRHLPQICRHVHLFDDGGSGAGSRLKLIGIVHFCKPKICWNFFFFFFCCIFRFLKEQFYFVTTLH